MLLFARYAELLGTARLELDLRPGDTVGDVVSLVRAQPGADLLPASLLVARNLHRVGPSVAVEPGDEIALLPPMAGG